MKILSITQMAVWLIATTSLNPTPVSPGSNLPTATANSAAISKVLEIAFGIIGALALLMITVSGLRYVLSAGNPERASKARNGIIYSLVGIVIAITAEAIVAFVVNNL